MCALQYKSTPEMSCIQDTFTGLKGGCIEGVHSFYNLQYLACMSQLHDEAVKPMLDMTPTHPAALTKVRHTATDTCTQTNVPPHPLS